MKKVLFTVVMVMCVTFVTNAQSGQIALGGGLVIALPIGDFSDGAGTGFGATARCEYLLNGQISLVGDIGYITYGEEIDGLSVSQIPVIAGIKYYFPGGFYGLGQLGLHFLSSEYDVPSNVWGFSGGSRDNSKTELGIHFGGGYETKVGNLILDFSGNFAIISDANQLVLRAGLKFPLK